MNTRLSNPISFRLFHALVLAGLFVFTIGFAHAAMFPISPFIPGIHKTDVGSQTRVQLQLHCRTTGNAISKSSGSLFGTRLIILEANPSLLAARSSRLFCEHHARVHSARSEYRSWTRSKRLNLLVAVEGPPAAKRPNWFGWIGLPTERRTDHVLPQDDLPNTTFPTSSLRSASPSRSHSVRRSSCSSIHDQHHRGGGPNHIAALSASTGYPESIAFDSAGNAYIAESYASQILEVSVAAPSP